MSMQAIERIKLPKPDTHCFDTDTDSDVWSYSPELVRETVLTHIDKLEKLAEERLQNCAALIAENERLRKDAERYRFIRDADRSDCIWREICIYAMETLDEYVDAAMDGEATMKGTP